MNDDQNNINNNDSNNNTVQLVRITTSEIGAGVFRPLDGAEAAGESVNVILSSSCDCNWLLKKHKNNRYTACQMTDYWNPWLTDWLSKA